MTQVSILRDVVVHPDGVRPRMYRKGEVASVTDIALAQLIEQGAVEIVENKAIQHAPETKPRRGRKRVSV